MAAIRKRQRAYFYTHKNQKNCQTFLYTKIQTLFKKLDNFRIVFIYKKPYTLRYGIFHEIFQFGIYIQKAWHFALSEFLYTKARNFAKSKTICYTFLYTKIRHFALRDFSLKFWNLRNGVDIYLFKKPYTLCYILYSKNSAFGVTLLYSKSLTLCVTF